MRRRQANSHSDEDAMQASRADPTKAGSAAQAALALLALLELRPLLLLLLSGRRRQRMAGCMRC
jgi:hypothetical protein